MSRAVFIRFELLIVDLEELIKHGRIGFSKIPKKNTGIDEESNVWSFKFTEKNIKTTTKDKKLIKIEESVLYAAFCRLSNSVSIGIESVLYFKTTR